MQALREPLDKETCMYRLELTRDTSEKYFWEGFPLKKLYSLNLAKDASLLSVTLIELFTSLGTLKLTDSDLVISPE